MFVLARRGAPAAPRHSPPIYAASRNAIDTVVEPIASCSDWYHTTSYMSAAQPLAANRISRAGKYRETVAGGAAGTA
jgi:hypothetical protein